MSEIENKLLNEKIDKLLNEKIDKLQNHFTTYKSDISDLKDTVKELTSAIVGSTYSGNKGIVHLVDKMCQRIDCLEQKNTLNDENLKNVKYASGVVFTALVTGFVSFIIWIFTKN